MTKKRSLEGLFNEIEQNANVADFDIFTYVNAQVPVTVDPQVNDLRMDVFLRTLLFSDKFSSLDKLALLEKINNEIDTVRLTKPSYNKDTLALVGKWLKESAVHPTVRTTISSPTLAERGETFLHRAIARVGSGERTSIPNPYQDILDIAFDVNPSLKPDDIKNDINDVSLLHLALRLGNIALAKKLIQRGADINALNKEWGTALHEAVMAPIASEKKKELIGLLLENKADPTILNARGVTPRTLLQEQQEPKI